MTTPATFTRNPTNAAGVLVIILAAANGLVAGIFGLLALSELDRYNDLRRSGNQFAGLVANSWTYLAGVTAVAGITAAGLAVVAIVLLRGKFRAGV